MFFPLCISLKINIFKELLKSNALTNFQEIWTDKFRIFLAFFWGGGALYIFFKKSNLPFLWLFDTCINNPLYDFFSSHIAKEIYIYIYSWEKYLSVVFEIPILQMSGQKRANWIYCNLYIFCSKSDKITPGNL